MEWMEQSPKRKQNVSDGQGKEVDERNFEEKMEADMRRANNWQWNWKDEEEDEWNG